MIDLYYRFPNSGTAFQIAYNAGFLISGENGWKLTPYTSDYAIDLIGPIQTGEFIDSSGVSVPLFNTTYHLNLRILSDSFSPPSLAEPYRIPTPNSPSRAWL